MSSLGITLLILVFVGIGGIIAYNAWMVRREGGTMSEVLHDMPPLDEVNRTEPSLDEQAADGPDATGSAVPDTTNRTGLLTATAGSPFEPVDRPFDEQHFPFEPGSERPDIPGNDETGPAPVQTNEPSTSLAGNALEDDNDPRQLAGVDAHSELPGTDKPAREPIDAACAQDGLDTPDPLAPTLNISDPVVESSSETAAPPVTAQDLVSPNGLDQFDCIVNLQPLDNIRGNRLLELTRGFSRVGAKPVLVAGIAADDPARTPVPLDGSQHYGALVFALLLVNRHGPVNAMEYSEFVNRVQTWADDLGVLADVPDMNSVLEHSRNLDSRLGPLDAQVAVNVMAEQTLNPADLQSVSGRLNLTEQGNNRYVRLNKDRQPVFSVSLGDKANRVVLVLDVPRVPRAGMPLREMVECAWKCSQAFEGTMVDDAGQPIDNALFERIEQQLDTHYQALQAAGVPAGSAQALRVFN